jgi:hypothetical protein
MAKRYYNKNDGLYSTNALKGAMEYEDSRMIKEDHKEIANLPQEVMMKPWPRYDSAQQPELNDTIRVIDEQVSADRRSPNYKKGSFPSKY